ncbi:MAG: NIL domain-containing protein [Elusimicrobiota bacterium]
MVTTRKVVLKFPAQTIGQPVIYNLVKQYGLQFNIMKAAIDPNKEEGIMVIEFSGEKTKYDEGMKYLKSLHVEVQPLSREILRNESKCTHCGACLAICPSEAFVVNPKNKKVDFVKSKCIACELCVKTCPPRAMEVKF